MDNFDFKPSQDVVTSTLTSIPLKAECSRFITSVDVSFDNGTTWTPSDTLDSNYVICNKDGKYEISLSNSKAPMSTMTINNGDTFQVQFRGWSRSGKYVYRTVNIRYVPPAQIKQSILAGAATQTGGGMVLHGRILSSKQNTASGGSYVVRGRIVQ